MQRYATSLRTCSGTETNTGARDYDNREKECVKVTSLVVINYINN